MGKKLLGLPVRHWLRIHAGIAVTAAAIIGVTAGGAAHHYRLDARGQAIYRQIEAHKIEQGARTGENLPPAQVAALARSARSAHRIPPFTAATPEPKMLKSYVRNASSRNGARPVIFVVHDTESPNTPGIQDVLAIRSWFDNPSAQASSNWTTDAEGNTIEMVRDTDKAWTQAYFNPYALSDEFIGYASQKVWPETQLRVGAQIAAVEMAKFGIPVRHALVSGCTIVRSGILMHNDLGQCGGGHHDAGPAFPMDHFIALVKEYQAGGVKHPVKHPTKRPVKKPVSKDPVVTVRGPKGGVIVKRKVSVVAKDVPVLVRRFGKITVQR